jgi:hypothetical protein
MANPKSNKPQTNGASREHPAVGSYFLGLELEHLRCFSTKQQLDLSDGRGRPARWTILLCCQICNQRHKRSLFPLADANRRAKSHHHDIKNEQPWFINPAMEEPSAFLEFHQEYLRSIDCNPRGKATIDALGLNREELVEMRRDVLGPIKVLINCRELIANQLADDPKPELFDQLVAINAQLVQCAKDSAQYAAMVGAVLRAAS